MSTTTTTLDQPVATRGERPAARHGKPTGWWGMIVLIITEAMIFAILLASYFFIRAASKEWPPAGLEPPELGPISLFTVVLLGSSLPIFWAEAGLKKNDLRRLKAGLLLSFLMGAIFLVNQVFEYRELKFNIHDNAYASLFYTITGLHGVHVFVGLLINVVVQLKTWLGRIDHERHLTMTVFGMYWHFVDAVWIFVFSSLYLSAHVR